MVKLLPALFVCLTLWSCSSAPPGNSRMDKLRLELEQREKTLATSLLRQDSSMHRRLYMDDAWTMPDYQPTLQGTYPAALYYREMLKTFTIKSFHRDIVEILDMDHTIVEWGTFSSNVQQLETDSSQHLTGKYMNIWSVQNFDSLYMVAEAWGYFQQVANPRIFSSLASLTGTQNRPGPSTEKEHDLWNELEGVNRKMEIAGKERNIEAALSVFDPDAVLMPFADSLKTGIQNIREYVMAGFQVKVEVDSISIHTAYAVAAGQNAIEYPVYYVRWHTDKAAGVWQGKSIRIWQRNTLGKLSLFREIIMRD